MIAFRKLLIAVAVMAVAATAATAVGAAVQDTTSQSPTGRDPVGLLTISGVPGGEGDSTSVPIYDFTAKVTNETTPSTGAGPQRAQFGDVLVVKVPDAASPVLLIDSARATVLTSATIDIFRTGDKNQTPYMTYTLRRVVVSQIEDSGDPAAEQLGFDYDSMCWQFHPADGSAPIQRCWSRSMNHPV